MEGFVGCGRCFSQWLSGGKGNAQPFDVDGSCLSSSLMMEPTLGRPLDNVSGIDITQQANRC